MILYNIHKLADRFIKLSYNSNFLEEIKYLLGKSINIDDIITWIDSNKTSLGNLPSYFGWGTHRLYGGMSRFDGEKLILISKNDLLSKNVNFDVNKIAVLHPSGKIPKLYLIIGQYLESSIIEEGKDIAHYIWLAKVVQKLFNLSLDDAIEETRYMVQHNSLKLQKIRNSFSISAPRWLGSGSDGVAFDIGEGKVLKIFSEQFSFQKTMDAIHRLHKEPEYGKTEAMVYDAGELKCSNKTIYYSIMEQMTPIWGNDRAVKDVRLLLERIVLMINKNVKNFKINKEDLLNEESKKVLHQKILRLVSYVKNNIMETNNEYVEIIESEINSIKKLNKNWLDNYIEEVIIKYLTGRGDLHMGNLGITDYGQLRYFDSAFPDYENEINT